MPNTSQSNTEPTRTSISVVTRALTSEESQSPYTSPKGTDHEVMERLLRQQQFHPETITSENCDYFQEVNRLRKCHPNCPQVWNFLAVGYQILGRHKRLEQILRETFEHFPKYLFARSQLAVHYLGQNQPQLAWTVMGGATRITELYPERRVFHITEYDTFQQVMVYYYSVVGDFEQAHAHLKYMLQIPPQDRNSVKQVTKILETLLAKSKRQQAKAKRANKL